LSKQFWLLSLFVFSHVISEAQINNYLVFFTDKENSSYSVNRPDEFLASKSIIRRDAQNISITSEDLPVNETYLQDLMGVGNVSIQQTTKWLNGALVKATPSEAESIKLLPFVRNLEYVAPENIGGRISRKSEIEELNTIQSDTLFQFDILGIGAMRSDGFEGEDMLVAVMDGGFSGMPLIPAFTGLFAENRVLLAYDFISRSSDVYQYSDHGTKVMSLFAARQTSPDFVGVVPNADFLLFVTEDVDIEYRIEEYRWLVAAEKADSAGVDVISSSLGYNYFDDPSMNYNKSQLDGQTAVITKAAEKAASKGILVVTSGGNTGLTDPWENVLFPGDLINGLAIGSISSRYSLSSFSPRGPTVDGRIKPDLLAMGSGTYVINKEGTIVNSSGTSFASPQVAGLATGIWQAYPDINVSNLVTAFLGSSSNFASPDNDFGYGVPSYKALCNYLSVEESDVWFTTYPNPLETTNYLRIKVYDPIADNNIRIKLFDTLGKPLKDEKLTITWKDNEYFLEMTSLPRGIYILNLQSDSNFSQVKILKL
jgi:subtilisin family serine protease